jgi:flagellar hook-associated protein 1
MSIVNLLHTGRSGLMASQVGIQTTGQNVTNAGVDGYNVRSVVLTPAAPTLRGGRGVEVERLVRASDPMLERTLLFDKGDSEMADARAGVLEPVSAAFGEFDADGLGAALDGMWSAFRLLEAQPADMAAREEVINSVENVSSAFHDMASMIQRERLSADDRMRYSVSRLNELAARIAEINEEIGVASASGSGHELMDQRDAMIREVASLIDTKVISQDNGMVNLVVASGMPLVEGERASEVRIDPGSLPGESSIQIAGSGSLWIDMNDRINSGQLAGLIQARDVDLETIETRLDQLAYDISTTINAQHQLGFGLDGVDGRDLFQTLAVVDGAASSIDIDAFLAANPDAVAAASVSGLTGDNRNAVALAALSTSSFAAGGTASTTVEYAAILGMAASTARQAADQSSVRQAALAQTETMWEQRVGVSVDEEMVDLITYEKAYQAASKLIALADGLYDAVLSMKRV